MKSTTTLRPAMPPFLFRFLAQARTTSTDGWKRPGTTVFSTSAIIATRISSSVIPTSAASGFPPWADATVTDAPTSATTIERGWQGT